MSAGEDAFEQSGPPVVVVNESGRAPFVLLCEHASRVLPVGYGRLGLPAAEFDRHIAWDLGAAEVATRLACLIDAPLFLAGYSRLLVDLNRPPGSSTSIPEVSDGAQIPGNIGIDAAERQRRRDRFFTPFHDAVAARLDAEKRRPVAVLGIHSFTPVFEGVARPWQAGVLFGQAALFGEALAQAIGDATGALVGRNEPYTICPEEFDYTVPIHGDVRGLPSALIEIRQDLVTDVFGIERWSRALAAALATVRPLIEPGGTPARG